MVPILDLAFWLEASNYVRIVVYVPSLAVIPTCMQHLPDQVITLWRTKKGRAVFIQPGPSRYCQR